jgi:sugar phosphate isomerase/epimerase
MSTFGYLYRTTVIKALESIARAGYRQVEFAPVPPHLLATECDAQCRSKLRRELDTLELGCVSVNPAELNLVSANREIRALAVSLYRACIELAYDLGARVQMVVPGRQNALIPMPVDDAVELLKAQLIVLLEDARRTGVILALETVPFGFLETTEAVARVVRDIGDPLLGIAVDCANTFGKEDISAGVRLAGSNLVMAQFSDAWSGRWAHTSIGRGEVDFGPFFDALRDLQFAGPCIYELVDGEDPEPRIGADLVALRERGWSL